jgi:hypothetical protein
VKEKPARKDGKINRKGTKKDGDEILYSEMFSLSSPVLLGGRNGRVSIDLCLCGETTKISGSFSKD